MANQVTDNLNVKKISDKGLLLDTSFSLPINLVINGGFLSDTA